MRIRQSKINYPDITALESSCYLLTDGMGGYSSTTLANSLTRTEHSFWTVRLEQQQQSRRINLVRKLDESIQIGEKTYNLSTQCFVNPAKNFDCFFAFNQFEQEYLPTFVWNVVGITIKKTVVLQHQHNTIGVSYEIYNPDRVPGKLMVTPQYAFQHKGQEGRGQAPCVSDKTVTCEDITLYYHHNGISRNHPLVQQEDVYFSYDARDGRDCVGTQYSLHGIEYPLDSGGCQLVYSLAPNPTAVPLLIKQEVKRQAELIEQAQAKSDFEKQLVRASDQFFLVRPSSDTTSLIAGYPFFEDWGRDTMIAMQGCCLSSRRFEEARRILERFMAYERRGLLPNCFEEGTQQPAYNTIDAPLQFIYALYAYYRHTDDLAYILENAFPTMEHIIYHYRKGTDYAICMEQNGLLTGGQGIYQLTWMDVCINGVMQTPRDDFPVEVNALWYNALRIYGFFLEKKGRDCTEIMQLSAQVKQSFQDVFAQAEPGLRDVRGPEQAAGQIRPNQLYAIGLPFPLLDDEQAKDVLRVVEQHLLTGVGLRSLSYQDEAFKGQHEGSVLERDLAYHQGTVWPFLVGQYVQAVVAYYPNDVQKLSWLAEYIDQYKDALYEGCIGQIAEIYDGWTPSISRGCFAQAWSIGELLGSVHLLTERGLYPCKSV